VPELAATFERVVAEYTAGDPVHDDVKWTNLTHEQIAAALDTEGTPVSTFVVRKLLRHFHYRRRKASKVLAMGSHPDSDAQFARLARVREQFLRRGQPVISLDTKKKELLGNFARPGTLLAPAAVKVFDHDFGGQARGVVIPHGIYDVARNRGHMTLGASHDTSRFAIDCLLGWWDREGHAAYPEATQLLILCDGGGSNGARTWLFKAELQRFADDTGLEVRVAHYPPYKSKYNPIEHRMFPHVDRAYRGVILKTAEAVRDLITGTVTTTGLEVTASILRGVYETGCKITAAAQESICCLRDALLGNWNYRILPHAL
jgi:hypothetical protein